MDGLIDPILRKYDQGVPGINGIEGEGIALIPLSGGSKLEGIVEKRLGVACSNDSVALGPPVLVAENTEALELVDGIDLLFQGKELHCTEVIVADVKAPIDAARMR